MSARLRLPIAWSIATTLGGIGGWFFTLVLTPFTWGGSLIVGGTLWGFGVGWTQRLVLQRHVPQRDWSKWLPLTFVGATGGWILVLVLFFLVILLEEPLNIGLSLRWNPAFESIVFFLGGTLLGLAQWIALGKARST